MTNRRFRVAALQMCATGDLAANLAVCKRRAAEAADRGAALLVLPENFAFLGHQEGDRLAVAERLDPAVPGPILSALVDMATRHDLWIIGGGMPEAIAPEDSTADPGPASPGASPGVAPTTGKTYNTCVVVDPRGALVASYRKIHLFDVDLPGRAVLRESSRVAPGRVPVVCDTPLGRIGLTICYDLRFPELYRELVVQRGAQIVVVPSAFTVPTGTAHWHVLLRSRAIENQCYVVAAAQTGQHNEKRASYGHTLIIDPWGTILDEIPVDEGLAMAEIDLDLLDETRQRMPCLQHQVLVRPLEGS
jgi:predicted amidohydrolase